MSREQDRRRLVDQFYREHGPCCAGCDWWRFHNSVAGECTKSAPVSGGNRAAMLGVEWTSLPDSAGHILTPRHHVCGDFVDTHDWSKQ